MKVTLRSLFAIVRDQQMLFVIPNKINADPNKWLLPGGHVKKGESFRDCFIREVEEEFGLKYTDYGMIKTVCMVEIVDGIVHIIDQGDLSEHINLIEDLSHKGRELYFVGCIYLDHDTILKPNEEIEVMQFFNAHEIGELDHLSLLFRERLIKVL